MALVLPCCQRVERKLQNGPQAVISNETRAQNYSQITEINKRILRYLKHNITGYYWLNLVFVYKQHG